MPAESKRVRYKLDDGRFRVQVLARNDHNSFRVEYGFRGDRPATKNAGDEKIACEVADTIWAGYQHGAIETPVKVPETVLELAEAIEERDGLTANTKRSYRSVWQTFAKRVGTARPIGRIYPSDVRMFLAGREDQTHDSYLRMLRAGFRYALERRWIGADPTEGIKKVAKHVMGPWLPYSEWPALLSACTDALEIRAGFALETGLRAGELAAARRTWLHGDVGRRAIKVVHDEATGFVPKHGTERSIPLTDRAEEWIARAAKKWGKSGFLFSSTGIATTNNWAGLIKRAVAESGVTDTDFHGLRRSAGAHWLDCGMDLFQVSRLLGHRDIVTTQRWYAALSDSTLVAAIADVERVERALGPAPATVLRRSATGSAKGWNPKNERGG